MEKILNEVIKNKYEVIAWNLITGHFVKTDLRLQSVVMVKKELHFLLSESSSQILKEVISGSGIINFYIPFKGILFSAELKKFDDKKLVTNIPSDFDSNDRRTENRYQALDVKITISYKDKSITKSCFDLSNGGFSVVFLNSEAIVKSDDDNSLSVTIRYGENLYELKAKLVGTRSVKPYENESIPYAGRRTSFEFIDLSANDRLFLNNIIGAIA